MNAKYIIVLLIILIAMSSVCEGFQQFARWAETEPTDDVSQSVNRIIRCSGCKQSATRENKRVRPKLSRKGPLPF